MDWKDACIPSSDNNGGENLPSESQSSLPLIRIIDPPPAESAIESATESPSKAHHNSEHFGRNIRLAMACMDAAQRRQRIKKAKTDQDNLFDSNSLKSAKSHARYTTKNVRQLTTELHNVSTELDTQRAELIELLLQFDEQDGWVGSGAKSCADWANANLGIAASTAYSLLQAGKALRELPIISSLFREVN